MKEVKVLGPGCAKCKQLMDYTEKAVTEANVDARVTKVTDIVEISSYGVMITPALVVDGEVKVSGKVPSIEEIKAMLA
jgi:small redox-active disulfide protein 2